MKTKFDIEIKDSKNICGGYLLTTEPMTKRQVVLFIKGLGSELIKNNRNIDRLSYTAWETDNEDYENAEFVGVIVTRSGRGVRVTAY